MNAWPDITRMRLQAGEGEDGRMKSAIGIGALLLDGLGDTIRVSLTEDPELEIQPCRQLAVRGRDDAHLAASRSLDKSAYKYKLRCVWQKSHGSW